MKTDTRDHLTPVSFPVANISLSIRGKSYMEIFATIDPIFSMAAALI
jgi:hypothetical protein